MYSTFYTPSLALSLSLPPPSLPLYRNVMTHAVMPLAVHWLQVLVVVLVHAVITVRWGRPPFCFAVSLISLQFIAYGTTCRQAEGGCDILEYCTGESSDVSSEMEWMMTDYNYYW